MRRYTEALTAAATAAPCVDREGRDGGWKERTWGHSHDLRERQYLTANARTEELAAAATRGRVHVVGAKPCAVKARHRRPGCRVRRR